MGAKPGQVQYTSPLLPSKKRLNGHDSAVFVARLLAIAPATWRALAY